MHLKSVADDTQQKGAYVNEKSRTLVFTECILVRLLEFYNLRKITLPNVTVSPSINNVI